MTRRRFSLRGFSLRDSTPALLTRGYAWLPDLRRRARGDVVTRVLGSRATGLRGPEAVRFFYDERHVRRHDALPEPVKGTLLGKDTVHSLDGPAHRARKGLFLSVLADPDSIGRLVRHVGDAWDETVATWPGRSPVVLFDEAAEIIARGVCRWAGVPVAEAGVKAVAADMVAMVDGFATLGPRHWRARRARGRRERWLTRLFEDVRAGSVSLPAGSPADLVERHRDAAGQPLPPQVAAVELLNFIRPTVAVAWFVAFAGHALHRRPETRQALRDGDHAYAEAFAQEVRRFYPFAPFVGGRAVSDLTWRGTVIPEGSLVLLDLYGQNHDATLWRNPYSFDPGRFVGATVGRDDLVPQGGGDPHTGHRCPGEAVTVALLQDLSVRLAALEYTVPPQDLTISLRRIPARPRSGVVLEGVRVPAQVSSTTTGA
ncbi:cytochrome P450 [Nonomuraea sp. MCN248]|uniref:Cytochrome P450 n=1 Tax=Nonomuraea corallina TaxID=2989783 RepID=A0ABT4S9D1_9ACTN|nr:cytochrome P450 [Nonomuraea corallina]MDA0633540.1 cytochrome P450 [Nonomuraea corallina]